MIDIKLFNFKASIISLELLTSDPNDRLISNTKRVSESMSWFYKSKALRTILDVKF